MTFVDLLMLLSLAANGFMLWLFREQRQRVRHEQSNVKLLQAKTRKAENEAKAALRSLYEAEDILDTKERELRADADPDVDAALERVVEWGED